MLVGKIGMRCVNMKSEKFWKKSEEKSVQILLNYSSDLRTPGSKLRQSTFIIHRLKLVDWGSLKIKFTGVVSSKCIIFYHVTNHEYGWEMC